MNNSYFVCDVAPMKLRVYCMHLLLHNNVEKKLHKNFMPLLTHENACIIHGSNMASSVYSRLFMGCTSFLFASLQVHWYYIVDFIVDFQWVFGREPVQGGKFQKSKKRGLILSVKLHQDYKEKNMTTTINCYLNTT